MTRTRYSIREKDGIHFLTCAIVDWLPILAKPETKEIVIDSLRFLQNKHRLTVFAYVIMENHIHLIAQANNLSAEITRFKSFTARKAIDFLRVENNSHYLDQLQANNHQHTRIVPFSSGRKAITPSLSKEKS
jgi:REP element-mobilizing transposase RayT